MSAAVFFKAMKPGKPVKAKKSEVREQGDGSPFAGLVAILAAHKVGSQFGPDKVKDGHDVTFKAGTFVGSGKVKSSGAHGCTVEDTDARRHDIRWHEVTGHKEPEGDAEE